MKLPLHFSYHFHPVGQGLFSSGFIHRINERTPTFLWVYDCGTSSSPDLVDSQINVLQSWPEPSRRIDLLTLSHFDHDHISGICKLLGKFEVGTLMLPYMALAQRLGVAFEEGGGVPGATLTPFYLNPVSFLLAQEGARIERILFVPPSGEDGPPFPKQGPDSDGPDGEKDPSLDFPRDKSDRGDEAEPLIKAGKNASNSTLVEFLLPGSSINVRGFHWEFVPYNDDPKDPISAEFVTKVERLREDLLSTAGSDKCQKALTNLKAAYDEQFGAGKVERNVISLFLYSGPVYSNWGDRKLFLSADVWPLNLGNYVHPYFFHCRLLEDGNSRCSLLYSGDGYLDTPKRLKKLTRFLSDSRVEKIGTFQVMHHGAVSNWHQGVAETIRPDFSVFSSDPDREKWWHPHAPVLRDFWPYGAVQVDKSKGFTSSWRLE